MNTGVMTCYDKRQSISAQLTSADSSVERVWDRRTVSSKIILKIGIGLAYVVQDTGKAGKTVASESSSEPRRDIGYAAEVIIQSMPASAGSRSVSVQQLITWQQLASPHKQESDAPSHSGLITKV